jgi:hypothetical protein
MRLYLDDDTASTLLAQLLRQAGHDVRVNVGSRDLLFEIPLASTQK